MCVCVFTPHMYVPCTCTWLMLYATSPSMQAKHSQHQVTKDLPNRNVEQQVPEPEPGSAWHGTPKKKIDSTCFSFVIDIFVCLIINFTESLVCWQVPVAKKWVQPIITFIKWEVMFVQTMNINITMPTDIISDILWTS